MCSSIFKLVYSKDQYLFFRAKNRKLVRLGRHGKIHYHIFHHAWNAYLRLINIDYQKSFTCPICKDCPDVVVFDGVTLGTIKEVPPFSMQLDKNQLIPPVPQVLRIFIPSKAKRQEILGYLENGLPILAFPDFVQSLEITPLANYIQTGSIVDDNKVVARNSLIKDVISYFTRNDPISGIFQFSMLEHEELKTVVKLSKGKCILESDTVGIFRKMYTLSRLSLSLECTKKNNSLGNLIMALHPNVCSLLTWVMERLEILFATPTRKLIPFKSTDSTDFSYFFPAFETQYK